MAKFSQKLFSSALIALFLASCGRESNSQTQSHWDSDSETGEDADTDTEVDSDTDSDTTSDTGTDSGSAVDVNLPPGCEGAIQFPDSGLNRVIRIATGIHSGDIFYQDLQGITSIHIADSG